MGEVTSRAAAVGVGGVPDEEPPQLAKSRDVLTKITRIGLAWLTDERWF